MKIVSKKTIYDVKCLGRLFKHISSDIQKIHQRKKDKKVVFEDEVKK